MLRTVRLISAVVCFSFFVAPALSAPSEDVIDLIRSGKLEQAYKICSTRPAIAHISRSLRETLKEYSTIIRRSREVRQETYATDVKKAKGYIAKNDIAKALTSIRKAKAYSKDKKKFIQSKWVKDVAEKANDKAEKFFKDHEWLKAGNLYGELASIYPDNDHYYELVRDCAKRVRFQIMYKKGGDWKEQLKKIKVEIIPEASFHIEKFYVKDANFYKMTLSGLNTILMMTEIHKLGDVFPSFKDKDKVKTFGTAIKGLISQVKEQHKKIGKFTKKEFWQAFFKLLIINQNSVALPDSLIIREYLDAAMTKLDPFSSIIWPADVDNFRKHTTGRFSGVGIQITMENNKLTVITPIPGTPAYHANIRPGDIIVSINGESTNGISIDEAVRKITGPAGTRVTLGILHPFANSPVEVPLIRDTIIIHTVKGYQMDKHNRWRYFVDPKDKIAYIRITSFTDTTVPDLKKVLKELTVKGMRGLILDLRFNPGGTLRAAYETVDQFISKGVIVSTKGKNVEPWRISATPSRIADIPMIVLINNYSASASEIVSGALKDYKRALILGERSFGKGSVQNVISMVNDSCRLKLTTAHYYLPNGKCIHKTSRKAKDWGVNPDVKIKLTPNEVRDIIELQRESEIVKQVNGKKVSTLPTTTQATKPARKYPPVDIQLKAAVAIMQAELEKG